MNKSGYLEFKITQSSRDAQLLFNIKKTLGFGSVTKQSKMSNTHHYRVRDKEGLEKIIEILNGNLQLKKRQDQFREFVEGFNKLYSTAIQIKPIQDLISLDKA
ncbi:MAG: LAGLIDADG family homing endonuclease [Bacteroidetes bacterium]|nr:LAGLIDADG family homing endonuclease [Bacteroidota bacterium]